MQSECLSRNHAYLRHSSSKTLRPSLIKCLSNAAHPRVMPSDDSSNYLYTSSYACVVDIFLFLVPHSKIAGECCHPILIICLLPITSGWGLLLLQCSCNQTTVFKIKDYCFMLRMHLRYFLVELLKPFYMPQKCVSYSRIVKAEILKLLILILYILVYILNTFVLVLWHKNHWLQSHRSSLKMFN